MRSASANDRLISLLTAALAILLGGSGARGQCEVAQLIGSGGLGGVSLDGYIAVVGDVQAFGSLGAVYVFRLGPGGPADWVLDGVLRSPRADPEENFGGRVAVSGDLIVAGAPGAAAPEFHSGAAYVYRHDADTTDWVYEASLTASDGDAGDFFGYSVSINGNVALVGAPEEDNHGVPGSGSAYLFRYNPKGPGQWIEESKLSDPEAEEDDFFGISVSVRGEVALIGAPGNDDAGSGTGAAFVFRHDPRTSRQWFLEQQLTAFDAQWQAWFGRSVSLAPEAALIGAPEDDSQNGSAYVYRQEGNDWTHEIKVIASKPVGWSPWFGESVSMDAEANSLVIGAPGDSELAFEAGAAHVFHHDGRDWKEVVKVTASDGGPGDHFGSSVSATEDTSLIAASGGVYVYAGIQGIDCNENGEPDACDIFEGTSDDQNGNGIPDACDADLNGDGVVGILDLLALLAGWGPCDPPCPPTCVADLDGNCTVNILDLLILLANWG